MIISTVGSHSALQILYGAKQEGFKTRVYALSGREDLYRRFPVADEIISLSDYSELLDIEDDSTILVPHGTLIATLDEKCLDIQMPIFGNREGMRWEMHRELNSRLLKQADIRTPVIFDTPNKIDRLVIVKFPGAKGGAGYFLCNSPEGFYEQTQKLLTQNAITESDIKGAQIQEYVVGVTMYPHYFYSPLKNRVELLGIDRRYETNVDALGRLVGQSIPITPTYTVVGNQPLIARESLLPKILAYGDRLRDASVELFEPGLIGPYCLETALTPEDIVAFEFTSRIVAGTTLYVQGSPYSQMLFGEEMSMGKRIAREIKLALKDNRLNELLS